MRDWFRRGFPWNMLFVMWWLCLLGLSTLQGPQLERAPFELNDKVAHFVFFGAGAWCLCRSLRNCGVKMGVALFGVPMILLAIGILDEWYQKSVPGRSGGDMGDVLADVAGGLAGTVLALLIPSYGKRK